MTLGNLRHFYIKYCFFCFSWKTHLIAKLHFVLFAFFSSCFEKLTLLRACFFFDKRFLWFLTFLSQNHDCSIWSFFLIKSFFVFFHPPFKIDNLWCFCTFFMFFWKTHTSPCVFFFDMCVFFFDRFERFVAETLYDL